MIAQNKALIYIKYRIFVFENISNMIYFIFYAHKMKVTIINKPYKVKLIDRKLTGVAVFYICGYSKIEPLFIKRTIEE